MAGLTRLPAEARRGRRHGPDVESFLQSASSAQSSALEATTDSSGIPMPSVPPVPPPLDHHFPSTSSGLSPKDLRGKHFPRKKVSADSGGRSWQRPTFRDVDFNGRSPTPPSPRTREAEARIRRYLFNQAPPVPQDVEERLQALRRASQAKRAARPKPITINSKTSITTKSKALEPGEPSTAITGLGIITPATVAPATPKKDEGYVPQPPVASPPMAPLMAHPPMAAPRPPMAQMLLPHPSLIAPKPVQESRTPTRANPPRSKRSMAKPVAMNLETIKSKEILGPRVTVHPAAASPEPHHLASAPKEPTFADLLQTQHAAGSAQLKPQPRPMSPPTALPGTHVPRRKPVSGEFTMLPPKPELSKPEPQKLQKSPSAVEKAGAPVPRGILKSSAGYTPKMQGSANSDLGFCAIMFALSLAGILSALEATILSTALPTIVANLSGGNLYMWAINAYFLTSTIFQPLYSQLANIFGHRWLILGAIALFAIGSAICGAAVNMQMLVGGRAVQGMGGGGIAMLTNFIVSDLVPAPQRGDFMAIFFVALTVGNGVGPFIGGVVVENINWRWLFYLNLPPAGVALILLIIFQDNGGKTQSRLSSLKRIDWIGYWLFISAITSLLFALSYGGSSHKWSDWQVLLPLALGGALLIAFMLWEASQHCKEPIIPPSLFGNRTSATAFVLSFLHSLLIIWVIYFLPVFFQGVQASTPSEAGWKILPTVLTIVPTAALSSKLLAWLRHYRPMHFLGFGLMTAGLVLYTMLDNTSYPAMWVGFQVLGAVGSGLVVSCLLPAVQAGLSEREEAAATSAWGFIRNFGIMLGVAIPSVLFNNLFNAASSQISDEVIQSEMQGGNAYELATAAFLNTLTASTAAQVQSAVAKSLQAMWYVATGIAGIAFLMVLIEADIPLRETNSTMLSRGGVPPVASIKTDLESRPPRNPPNSREMSRSSDRGVSEKRPLMAGSVDLSPLMSASPDSLTNDRDEEPGTGTLRPVLTRARPSVARRPIITTRRVTSRYASIPIMLDESNELQSPSGVLGGDLGLDIPSVAKTTPASTVPPTPPEFRPLARNRSSSSLHNSWVPWIRRSIIPNMAQLSIRQSGGWNSDSGTSSDAGSRSSKLPRVCSGQGTDKEVSPPKDNLPAMAQTAQEQSSQPRFQVQRYANNGGRDFGHRVTRLLEQLPRELEEELGQLGEWESQRRSNSTFNYVA